MYGENSYNNQGYIVTFSEPTECLYHIVVSVWTQGYKTHIFECGHIITPSFEDERVTKVVLKYCKDEKYFGYHEIHHDGTEVKRGPIFGGEELNGNCN